MNNREAITLLRNLEDSLDSYCELNEEGKTAFRMAIEALNCSEIPNNSDTISRQAAIDKIKKRLYETAFNNVGVKQDVDETLVDVAENRLKNWFKELPSAQPERKKGKWLPDTNNNYEERFVCSVCGRSYKVDTCMGKPMWDFCPCGADMRGEENETVKSVYLSVQGT